MNEDIDPYYRQQKCRPMTLIYGDVRFMRIFAEVPLGGGVRVVDDGNFQRFRRLFLRKV